MTTEEKEKETKLKAEFKAYALNKWGGFIKDEWATLAVDFFLSKQKKPSPPESKP